MIRQPARRTMQAKPLAKTAKSKQIKKESPFNKNILLISAALLLVIVAVSLRSKEKTAPPVLQPAVSETGEAKTETAGGNAKDSTKQQETVSPDSSGGFALMPQIKVTPENPKVGDTVKINAVVPGSEDGTKLPFTYEWRRNGEKLEETSSSLVLAKEFKRGDKIEAVVTLDDGKGKKKSWDCKINISNSPPEIVSATDITRIDNNRFTFQVKAKDADGDQLKYSLRPPVEGATIDSTGKVILTVPEGKKGKVPISVYISDEHGGEATYNFGISVDIGKP